MLHKSMPLWPAAVVEEVETLAMHFRTARESAQQLWPSAPRWLHRYWEQMMSAHAGSLTHKGCEV
ncbi:MAG TPA: hypothetical protein VME21_14890 [Steroidobacteraceae bacterium]|nr:hypothetical protein [Steroidobacteraceae bacterium]